MSQVKKNSYNDPPISRNYYENLIPPSPTDHMELREGTDEDEDVEDCVDDAIELMPTLEENFSVPINKDISNEKVTDQEKDLHDSDTILSMDSPYIQ